MQDISSCAAALRDQCLAQDIGLVAGAVSLMVALRAAYRLSLRRRWAQFQLTETPKAAPRVTTFVTTN